MKQDEPNHARLLRDFCTELKLDDVPAATREAAKALFLDTLGCGLFGAQQPWSKALIKEMRRDGSSGLATVFGDVGVGLPPASAALCNGTSVHGFELDDLIARRSCTPAR